MSLSISSSSTYTHTFQSPTNQDHQLAISAIEPAFCRIEGVGNLRALSILNDHVVWVGGTGGKIAKTADNGQTWSLCSLPDGEALDVRALYVSDSQTACAMCAGSSDKKLARVYRTTDGGIHWQLVLCPETKGLFFNGMVFWSKQEGILLSDPVDERFVLFKTKNAGETWEQVNPSSIPFAMPGECAFAASNSCITVQGKTHVWFGTGGAESARIFYSDDTGDHWNVVLTPMQVSSASAGIFSLAFIDENTGLAVGGDHRMHSSFKGPNMMITRNGGKKWEVVDDKELKGKYLSSVAWSSDKQAVVVDGSQGKFNTVALSSKHCWLVGPNQNFAQI